MNVVKSNLTYAGGKLFFSGAEVAGFRSLKVCNVHGYTRVTVFKGAADAAQVAAMRAADIKIRSIK